MWVQVALLLANIVKIKDKNSHLYVVLPLFFHIEATVALGGSDEVHGPTSKKPVAYGGYLEAEGLEKTWRIKQEAIAHEFMLIQSWRTEIPKYDPEIKRAYCRNNINTRRRRMTKANTRNSDTARTEADS
ncbi:hypothetical protein JHK86_043367 [Glycine max]|nr:hypothetical protein JHK86_043367 [Glycine max]